MERPLAKALRETFRGSSHPLNPSVTRYPSLYCVHLALDVALHVDNIAVECKQVLVLALALVLCTDN